MSSVAAAAPEAATADSSAEVENIYTAGGVFEGGGLILLPGIILLTKTKTGMGFSMFATRLGEAEKAILFF